MSRQKKNPETQWFVEPLDYDSNVQIMDFLSKTNSSSADIEHVRIPDFEGKLHNVLEVSYDAMSYMVKSRKDLPGLRFKTWNRVKSRTPLRECSFLFARRGVKRSAEVKRVERQLAKIKTPFKPSDSEPF